MNRSPPNEPADIDPTRVLDGFALPAQRSDDPLDLSGLLSGLRQAAAPPPAAVQPDRQAWLKQHGFEMSDVEDVEVTEIRLPQAAQPLTVNLDGIDAALNAAVAQAQSRQALIDPSQIGLSTRNEPAAANPRLLTQWRPGAWIGLRRRVLDASTELLKTPEGPVLENLPPQWLLAVWPPLPAHRPPGRWPEQARLVGGQGAEAAAESLLQGMPEQAQLWIGEWDVDWALLAELVLHHDPALKPFQIKALRDLAEAERLAAFAVMNDTYRSAVHGWPLRRK